MNNYWGFIIDTDDYAGSFERELCAHITGRIGECEVGKGYVDQAITEKFDNVIDMPDEDNGCLRPCQIFPNPRYKNNGMGFIYQEGQEELALEELKKSAIAYGEKVLNSYRDKSVGIAEQLRWLEEANGYTLEDLDHPAYCSVIIYFSERPSDEQIVLMKERAATFKGKGRDMATFNIEGFRLCEFKMTTVSTDI